MAEYEFPGEAEEFACPAVVNRWDFHGVVIYKLRGTEAEVSEAAALLQDRFPDDDKKALGNAIWIGFHPDHKTLDLYDLFILRKPGGQNHTGKTVPKECDHW